MEKLFPDAYRVQLPDPDDAEQRFLLELFNTGDGTFNDTREEGYSFGFMSNRSYSFGIHCWILIFDITSKQSFDLLPKLHEYIASRAKHVPSGYVVVGNKLDLADQRRVSQIEAAAFARSIGAEYIESSAKTAENISKVPLAALAIHRKHLLEQASKRKKKPSSKCIIL